MFESDVILNYGLYTAWNVLFKRFLWDIHFLMDFGQPIQIHILCDKKKWLKRDTESGEVFTLESMQGHRSL